MSYFYLEFQKPQYLKYHVGVLWTLFSLQILFSIFCMHFFLTNTKYREAIFRLKKSDENEQKLNVPKIIPNIAKKLAKVADKEMKDELEWYVVF